jgi:hypothetical protein
VRRWHAPLIHDGISVAGAKRGSASKIGGGGLA